MPYANLADDDVLVNTGNDSIVIRRDEGDIRGGKTLSVVGFVPSVINAGHVIIKETATGYFKPMPATDARVAGAATVDTLVAGTGYTNGTYENVPLRNTDGTGSGALATVVVALTVVSSVTITYTGSGYTIDDTLAIPGAYAGGTATAEATVDVASIATVAAAYGALPSGHTYVGILKASILTKRPFASILTHGEVNDTAAPYDLATILSAFKTATNNQIMFAHD